MARRPGDFKSPVSTNSTTRVSCTDVRENRGGWEGRQARASNYRTGDWVRREQETKQDACESVLLAVTTQSFGQKFQHVEREKWMILNEKRESFLVDHGQLRLGLRYGVRTSLFIVDQRQFAEDPARLDSLHHLVTNSDIDLSPEDDIHMLTVLSRLEYGITR